jgi:Bacterial Ig-like domain (group 1)
VSVVSSVTLDTGTISTLTTVQTSISPGTANITSYSQGYTGSSVTVTTEIPAPYKLAIYVAPNPKIVTPLESPIMAVQLQDAGGNPARAKADTSILITSSNASLVGGNIPSLLIPKGDDFNETQLSLAESGSTTLTASTSGLVTSQVTINLIPLPLSTTLASSATSIYSNGTATLTVSVRFLGAPLQGATVTWLATGGSVSPSTSDTSADGTTVAKFTPSSTGNANITAVVSDEATGLSKLSAFVSVINAPPKPPLTILQFFEIYGLFVVVPLVVVLAYLVYYFRKRRRKAKEELEAAFQTIG